MTSFVSTTSWDWMWIWSRGRRLQHVFLWIPNLALPDPFYILPVVVTVTQFIQQRMAMPQRCPVSNSISSSR